MKALFVGSFGDYGAINFQNVLRGTPVKEVINNLEHYKTILKGELEDYEYEDLRFEIKELNIDKESMDWIREKIEDYDDSKHQTIWLECETI